RMGGGGPNPESPSQRGGGGGGRGRFTAANPSPPAPLPNGERGEELPESAHAPVAFAPGGICLDKVAMALTVKHSVDGPATRHQAEIHRLRPRFPKRPTLSRGRDTIRPFPGFLCGG